MSSFRKEIKNGKRGSLRTHPTLLLEFERCHTHMLARNKGVMMMMLSHPYLESVKRVYSLVWQLVVQLAGDERSGLIRHLDRAHDEQGAGGSHQVTVRLPTNKRKLKEVHKKSCHNRIKEFSFVMNNKPLFVT